MRCSSNIFKKGESMENCANTVLIMCSFLWIRIIVPVILLFLISYLLTRKKDK